MIRRQSEDERRGTEGLPHFERVLLHVQQLTLTKYDGDLEVNRSEGQGILETRRILLTRRRIGQGLKYNQISRRLVDLQQGGRSSTSHEKAWIGVLFL